MPFYSDQIREHFLCPRNAGDLEGADAVGDVGSLVCGAALRFTLKIDAATYEITRARFKATGCGVLIAAASVLTETLSGLAIGEAARLSPDDLTEKLNGVPPGKTHCLALCCEALHAAAVAFRAATLEEWTGEEALICTCFGVSETRIEREIMARVLNTIPEVTSACNAGGGCGSCHPLIEDMLDDCWRTREARISNLAK